MRILLSNNDGIYALSIQQRAVALRQLTTVQIVTVDALLRTQTQPIDDITILPGMPTDCVYLVVNALMCPGPDIVVSGINAGPNLGDDVIYSGTVAAAMEGGHLGYPALAVSLDGSCHFTTTAVTCRLLHALAYVPLRTGKILNVNVPDWPLSSINGCKITRCGSRHSVSKVIRQTDPHGREMLWIGPPASSFDEGLSTNFEAVSQGYASLTPLQVDLTAYAPLSVLSDWLGNIEGFASW